MHPTKFPTGTLIGPEREPRHHDIIPPVRDGWSQIAMMEWELRGESWTDQHPHDEYNYLLAGRLFVEAGGVAVELGPGDVVRVPAGAVGRYWAPQHARMLAIYGPNPDGHASEALGLERLAGHSRLTQRRPLSTPRCVGRPASNEPVSD